MKKILVEVFFRASIAVLLLALFTLSAKALPPCETDTAKACPFKKATIGGPHRNGTFYCAAEPGHQCGYTDQSVTVELDPGMVVDTSYYQGSGYWCCWRDGEVRGMKLKECVPPGCNSPLMPPANAPDLLGLYVEVTGTSGGSRGIYIRSLKPDIGNVRRWTIKAYVFCEPDWPRPFHPKSACDTTGEVWVKQRAK